MNFNHYTKMQVLYRPLSKIYLQFGMIFTEIENIKSEMQA